MPTGLRGDPGRLRQVLINLVNNAIKFTDAGGVTVRIDGPPAGSPRIIVTDTGQGIGSCDLDNIFNAFERGREGEGGHREGTGLGLHICRELAELIDGEITVESREGVGSTFSVVLKS